MKPDWYRRVEEYAWGLQAVPWMESPLDAQHDSRVIVVTNASINGAFAKARQEASKLQADANAHDQVSGNDYNRVVSEAIAWSNKRIRGKILAGLVNTYSATSSEPTGKAFRRALDDYKATQRDDWWGDSAKDAVAELLGPMRTVLSLQLRLNVAGAHLPCPPELRDKIDSYFRVWSSGYAMLGDVNGHLVAYGVDRSMPRGRKKLRIPDLSGERNWLEVDE